MECRHLKLSVSKEIFLKVATFHFLVLPGTKTVSGGIRAGGVFGSAISPLHNTGGDGGLLVFF